MLSNCGINSIAPSHSRLTLRAHFPSYSILRPLSPPSEPAAPRAGTRAAIALDLIHEWARQQAELVYASPYRHIPMPWSAFLKEECCWQLAHLYTKATPPAFWDDLTVEALEAVAPLLISWKYRDAYSDQLLEQLKSIVEPVSTTYEENRPRRRREKNDQAAAYSVRQLLLASTLKGYNTQVRVRDNSLAALD